MQVCTYLDRRFVTSLLSRPNCFSRKASTICYAQPVKENKSLEVLVLPSPPQWAFEGCCWSGNRGKITGSASASILSPSSSTHALRHFLLVLTEPRFAKYTLHFSILLCLCFVFLTRARSHGVLFWLWVLTENVWPVWRRAFCLNKICSKKNISFLIKNDDFQTLCWQQFFWLQPFNSSVGGHHPSKCIGHQKSGGNFVGARNDQPRHAKFIGWRHRSLGRQGRTRGNVITLPYILSEKKKLSMQGVEASLTFEQN